jgi:dTDP-4-amino-4,6-dideoxygalactose transaminase
VADGSAPARVYLSPPHMGASERQLLLEAFDSNWIAPLGPHVDAFERELSALTSVPHAAALSSGTAALHLALQLLEVGRGDEVWASTLTFAASVNPIVYQHATPVFLDSEEETWNLDPALLADELASAARQGKLPKALIVVDLYGQCAQLDRIEAICAQYGVALIEDAAEALGATWKGRDAGSFGQFGVYSFNGNKIITTSGGGMLVSRDRAWIERARFLATQARDPAPHYQHSQIGHNYRLSNLLAAIGRGQLQVLSERMAARRAHRRYYEETLGTLPGVGFMPLASHGTWNGWLTVITVNEERFGASSEALRLALERENIESRPVWKPMHLQPVFQGCKVLGGKVAERAFASGLCLPSGSSLDARDRERVVECITSQCRE